jgi:ribosomal-protein-alanine N-acetyltransferase
MCPEEIGAADKLQIRSCERRDVATLLEILAQAPEAAAWSGAAMEEALSCDAPLFLGAALADELVGFAVARLLSGEAEILNFAVQKVYRRRGIGRLLLEALLNQLRELGATKVFLEVRESNAAAIAFYRKLGFQNIGRRHAYYQQPDEAAVIMQAELQRNPLPALQNSRLP